MPRSAAASAEIVLKLFLFCRSHACNVLLVASPARATQIRLLTGDVISGAVSDEARG